MLAPPGTRSIDCTSPKSDREICIWRREGGRDKGWRGGGRDEGWRGGGREGQRVERRGREG